jgi:hypothetical protein
VDPGASLEFSVAYPGHIRDTTTGFPPFVLPAGSVLLAYGWRDSSTDAALRVSGGLSSVFQLTLDAYAQLPRWALLGLDAGVGVTSLMPSLAASTPMPYAELGWVRSGSGPYVIAGYVHESIDTLKVEGPEVLHADGWEATAAYQVGVRGGYWRPFATAIIGHRYTLHCAGKFSDCSGYPRPMAFFVGIELEGLRPHR